MILLVRLGDQRRNPFKGGKHAKFLPVSVPRQHLVEEPETLHRRCEPRRAARRSERRLVDSDHVGAKRIVDRHYRIDWTNHDILPFTL